MSELTEDEREALIQAVADGSECECVEGIIAARTRAAVEAALAPIEAVVSQWPVSDNPRTEYRAAVSQCAEAVRSTLAVAARDAAGRSGGEG